MDQKIQIEAFLKSLEGPLGTPETMEIEYGAVRRMALAIDDLDPIHYDEAAALVRGYCGIVAPWPLLWLVFFSCSEFEFDYPFGLATVHGEDAYSFHEPIIVGDVITVKAEVARTSVKQGKSGLMGMLTQRRSFYNQTGKLCAVLDTTVIRR